MLRLDQSSLLKVICFTLLSWSCTASAIYLGVPKLQSVPGEPLRVEIPIRSGPDEKAFLSSLTVELPSKAAYEKLGISQKILDLNPQVMVYRNRQEQLMVLVESVNPVPVSNDPFLDILVKLNWSSGSLTKTYTFLLGDTQKVIVKPGQSLSEIATIMAPRLEGASLDQTMLALYKANPEAFASGSINRLNSGAELNKPSQALLRSISPVEAHQFVADANEQWRADQGTKGDKGPDGSSKGIKTKAGENAAKDRLKIGSSAEGSAEERRYTEELVAQEKELEQAKARVAELQKNIADLQRLLEKSKDKKSVADNFGLGGFGPAVLAMGLIAFTGLLLWVLARNARGSESSAFAKAEPDSQKTAAAPNFEMPERAKALFSGIDLDLSTPAQELSAEVASESNPLADTLRVKLNLARAYITIEDYSAAKKSLEEIIRVSNSVDPTITIEAQGLLSELSHRQA
jgi:pilus assembly protein FimV